MQHDNADTDRKSDPHADAIDLVLLFMSDLHVGKTSIYRLNSKTPFWVRYEIDGRMRDQSFLTTLSWRALMLLVLQEGRKIVVHEMDEPGRLKQIFPDVIIRRLEENSAIKGGIMPVLKLIDPAGPTKVIITRSRCRGHAVDALHNMTDGKPVFQPVWVTDLLRLNSKIGMKLVRDETFSAGMPIKAYLEAAAIAGRIVDGPELSAFPLTGSVPRLPMPDPTWVAQKIFDLECRKTPVLKKLRDRTIYDDY